MCPSPREKVPIRLHSNPLGCLAMECLLWFCHLACCLLHLEAVRLDPGDMGQVLVILLNPDVKFHQGILYITRYTKVCYDLDKPVLCPCVLVLQSISIFFTLVQNCLSAG